MPGSTVLHRGPWVPREPNSGGSPPHGHLVRTGAISALLLALMGCFETEYGPLIAGRPHYELIHLEESYDAVCAIPSTAVINTSLEPHPEHRRNMLDYSIDEEGREVVRNHTHEAYGFSDFHAERRPDYDDERGEAWLTFIHGEHVQEPPEGADFWIAYRSGADCHPDNNLMLFPYAVNPEPPPMQIVAVPIIVDGAEPELDEYYFLDPFYKSLFEVWPLTEISMRNRALDDPDLRIRVPVDSPAFDAEAGTLDLYELLWPYVDEAESIRGVQGLWADWHQPREIFMGFYDAHADEWLDRWERGLQSLNGFAFGSPGWVIFEANGPGELRQPPVRVPFLEVGAHEIGHAMDLGHAPCGVDYADPLFPHADGGMGGASMWGEIRNDPEDDFRRGPLMSDATEYADVMSYCTPTAVSPYHFNKALDWQVHGLDEWESQAAAASGPSLVLAGTVGPLGEPVVTSASISPQPAYAQSGPFTVEAFDAHGFLAAAGSFRAAAVYGGNQRAEDVWSVRMPLPQSLGSVQISGADGRLLSEAQFEAAPSDGRRYKVIAH